MLQLADDELNVRSHGTLYVVPELPRNSRLSITSSCLIRERFYSRTLGRDVTYIVSNSSFNVQRSLSAGLGLNRALVVFRY